MTTPQNPPNSPASTPSAYTRDPKDRLLRILIFVAALAILPTLLFVGGAYVALLREVSGKDPTTVVVQGGIGTKDSGKTLATVREVTKQFTVGSGAVTAIQYSATYLQVAVRCINTTTAPTYFVESGAANTTNGDGPYCTDASTCPGGAVMVSPSQLTFARTSLGTATLQCGFVDQGFFAGGSSGAASGPGPPFDLVYLRLDTTNDPLTGQLLITVPNINSLYTQSGTLAPGISGAAFEANVSSNLTAAQVALRASDADGRAELEFVDVVANQQTGAIYAQHQSPGNGGVMTICTNTAGGGGGPCTTAITINQAQQVTIPNPVVISASTTCSAPTISGPDSDSGLSLDSTPSVTICVNGNATWQTWASAAASPVFQTSAMRQDANAATILGVINANGGANANVFFSLVADNPAVGQNSASFVQRSTGAGTSGLLTAGQTYLGMFGAAGGLFYTLPVAGDTPIVFATGGTGTGNERLRLSSTEVKITGAINITGNVSAGSSATNTQTFTGQQTQTFAPAANLGTANNATNIVLTTPADSSGTNTHDGLKVTWTIGNASAGTNTVNGIEFPAVTGDAEVTLNAIKIGALTGTAATETAINIGSGWDTGITTGSAVNISPGAAVTTADLRILGATGEADGHGYFSVSSGDSSGTLTGIFANGTSGSMQFAFRPIATGATANIVSLGTSAQLAYSINSSGGNSMFTTLTFSAITTDITTGTNEDLNITPNGTGVVNMSVSGNKSGSTTANVWASNVVNTGGVDTAWRFNNSNSDNGDIDFQIAGLFQFKHNGDTSWGGSTSNVATSNVSATGGADTFWKFVATGESGDSDITFNVDDRVLVTGPGHVKITATTPSSYTSGTCTNETGAGDDDHGSITADCTAGQTAIATFGTAYAAAPYCVCTPANAAADLVTLGEMFCDASTTALTVTMPTAVTAAKVNFHCIE